MYYVLRRIRAINDQVDQEIIFSRLLYMYIFIRVYTYIYCATYSYVRPDCDHLINRKLHCSLGICLSIWHLKRSRSTFATEGGERGVINENSNCKLLPAQIGSQNPEYSPRFSLRLTCLRFSCFFSPSSFFYFSLSRTHIRRLFVSFSEKPRCRVSYVLPKY